MAGPSIPDSGTQHNLERMPNDLKVELDPIYNPAASRRKSLRVDRVFLGDARDLLPLIEPNSIAVSVWSPPYFVGKEYEADLTFESWKSLLADVIQLHFPILKPGAFLVVNIADILTFKDETMPRIQAEVVSQRKSSVTRQDVLDAMEEHPDLNRYQLAKLLRCSEQTIDRRLNGNNIRGGKYETQSRVKIVGGLVEKWAIDAGLFPYDRRIWVKDPAWVNSRWASSSYRSIDEFEYLYTFWKPGVTRVDRRRLTKSEWSEWGSRGVWHIPSVRSNDDHEAKFPVELPRRVIKLLSDRGDTVLDCFLGSGSTAIAAIREARRFIGIEIVPDYISLAKKNIKREKSRIANQPNEPKEGSQQT